MPSRSNAKEGITKTEDEEPELQNAITVGHQLQLDLLREKNRHRETIQKQELGWIGRFFGGENTASLGLAFAAVFLGFLGVVLGYVMAALQPISQAFGGKEIGFAYTLISSALSFVFGRSSMK